MPIYEYQCDCGKRFEGSRSIEDRHFALIVCACGEIPRLKMSVSSFVMRQTGKGMALDTLNDKHNGMPNKWWKTTAEQNAAAGL